jgi:hypothetical protein
MDAEISETIVEINDLHKLNPNFGELEQTEKYPGKSTTCVCSPTLASVERWQGWIAEPSEGASCRPGHLGATTLALSKNMRHSASYPDYTTHHWESKHKYYK